MKLTREQRDVVAALKGKRIARVTLNAFDPDEGTGMSGLDGPATDPVIWFTDGSCLSFVVQETEGGEYGVELVYSK